MSQQNTSLLLKKQLSIIAELFLQSLTYNFVERIISQVQFLGVLISGVLIIVSKMIYFEEYFTQESIIFVLLRWSIQPQAPQSKYAILLAFNMYQLDFSNLKCSYLSNTHPGYNYCRIFLKFVAQMYYFSLSRLVGRLSCNNR
ncbi:Hypothetical_protein [Hexamita inflata]|uniref:Hypothetical_protein n=1 Tax=Hexamita inflata TaxID=28002 RepID=A0AA86TG94_9EUKA|nr:Hypothetical protein HINF_LOCUS4395 [Hexamita inflata]